MPHESELLCGGWAWDPVMRELRHYPRSKKAYADEPDGVEQLKPVSSVTWHRWGQLPMASPTGGMSSGQMSRVVAAFEGGGDIEINENERECAGKLASAIAASYGLEVIEAGAPDGRRGGNLPQRDSMGRLVSKYGRGQVVLDEATGEIMVSKPRLGVGSSRKRYSTREVRRLELAYDVKGPEETFTVYAVLGGEEERVPVASYTGYEGWADPGEWRGFADELGRTLGVPVEGTRRRKRRRGRTLRFASVRPYRGVVRLWAVEAGDEGLALDADGAGVEDVSEGLVEALHVLLVAVGREGFVRHASIRRLRRGADPSRCGRTCM